MKNEKITVKLDEKNPEPVEIIAKSIIELSEACEKINSGKLNRRAISVLLQDATGLPLKTINLVLNTLPELKNLYLKK